MSKYLQSKLWVYNTEWLSVLLMRQTAKKKESNMKEEKQNKMIEETHRLLERKREELKKEINFLEKQVKIHNEEYEDICDWIIADWFDKIENYHDTRFYKDEMQRYSTALSLKYGYEQELERVKEKLNKI